MSTNILALFIISLFNNHINLKNINSKNVNCDWFHRDSFPSFSFYDIGLELFTSLYGLNDGEHSLYDRIWPNIYLRFDKKIENILLPQKHLWYNELSPLLT